jgi:hypothetical protein
MNKFIKPILLILILFTALTPAAGRQNEGCTTAIINGAAAADGAPMLWKNRDTDSLSNKVIYVEEKPYSYLALVDAKEESGRWAFAGLNSEGFAVMNSVAYNLPENKSGEMKDLEGLIMADALRTCRTVDDFEKTIKKNLGPGLGSWANYGVIDANGRAVIFEVYNDGYTIYDSQDAPEKYLINTNFARSGKEGKGAGYLRFDQAVRLFKEIKESRISHRCILGEISRDFGHTLLNHPTPDELRKISLNKPVWVLTRDTISRTITSAAVVICGKKPGDNNSTATFWIIPGEPVTAVALPLWVEAGETPLLFCQGETAPLWQESLRIKQLIRPFPERDKQEYMLATRLVNKEQQGFLPLLLGTEQEIFAETAEFLKTSHTREEYAAFQNRMAQKALDAMKKIK